MTLTLKEIREACGGMLLRGDGGAAVDGAETDTRRDVKGRLFVAVKGAKRDGHDYVRDALEKGAVCSLVERDTDRGGPVVKVPSTRAALLALASYSRERFKGHVAAVTGSAGKTTTKDMLASVLAQRYRTHKTPGNYNNELGLPLSMLNRGDDTEALVLEMGMNHAGEISVLSNTARPHICIITNIGDAHLEHLGNREGVLKAKTEIMDGLTEGGALVINKDDPLLASIVPAEGMRIFRCSASDPKADAYVSDVEKLGAAGTRCVINIKTDGGTLAVAAHIRQAGAFMVMNACMAAAAGALLGLSAEEIGEGLRTYEPSGNRMDIREAKGMTIINDTYNANPDAVRAAVDALVTSAGGRTVCILGDMLELGSQSEALHRKTGTYIAKRGVDMLIAIGDHSWHTYDAYAEYARRSQIAVYFADKDEFIIEIGKHLLPGDTVLIKASRGMAFETLVDVLTPRG
uniref:UDP-N-acetylmuramoyl-tripeptide--D-alanyl-D-alanine ligase n=1 Tax=uncultured bacterium contig00034 TaxID=1181523 RepID=A0A806KC17_9BACT|nr:UDP-N-acetylmuramoylalanyl-D-glutamyl-2,6-diaminopimelate--D-alanyl-D-alanine ligase [uncultured bacterium contig00034]